MNVPDYFSHFKATVKDRIKNYCQLKIWPFDYDSFLCWLNNFNTEAEEYFALQLLNNLIVRSKVMACSGYSRLLNTDIRNRLIDLKKLDQNNSIPEWEDILLGRGRRKDITILPVQLLGDKGESGGSLYRTLSPLINTGAWGKDINSIDNGVIIFVDDILGSGNQFETFSKENNLSEIKDQNTIIFCPLIACEHGLSYLRETVPYVEIFPVETLSLDQSIFDDRGQTFFNDGVNTIEASVDFYLEMKEKYSPQMPEWLGRDNVGLPIVFEWGCPNQTPSILWMREASKLETWYQLFSRRA